MSFQRKAVGEPLNYRGHVIQARYMGPDLLCYVDDSELGAFYETVEKAHQAGMKYVDHIEKEKQAKH